MAFTIVGGKLRNLSHAAWMWNPFNKVFQDHRDGTIDHDMTNLCRDMRGLPIPWTPEIGTKEVMEAPVK